MGDDGSNDEEAAAFYRELYADRSQEELDWELAFLGAMGGIDRGDLQPLADYLRSSFDMDVDLRRKVADAIEGKLLYRISCKKTRPGPGTEADVKFPNFELQRFVAERKAAGVRVKQIEWEVEERFGLKRSAMYDQLRSCKAPLS